MRILRTLVSYRVGVLVVLAVLVSGCRAGDPSGLEHGGRAYLAQCAVCHGVHGDGDGPAASENRAAEAYALTAARTEAHGREGVRRAIRSEVHLRPESKSMPPWGAHLGDTWTDRITDYVMAMPKLGDRGRGAVSEYLSDPPGSPSDGRRVYVMYCSGCHGPRGEGDGFFSRPLSKLIEAADLTESVPELSDDELEEVIEAGGAHAPNSETMPGWIYTTTSEERAAVAGYLRFITDTEN